MIETFAYVLRKRRKELNLSVKEFITKLSGLLASISRAYVTKLELHDEIPSKELTKKIAIALEIDENYLLELAKEGKRKQFEKVLNQRY